MSSIPGFYSLSSLAEGKPVAKNLFKPQKGCQPSRHQLCALKIILNQYGFEARQKTRQYNKEFKQYWLNSFIVERNYKLIKETILKVEKESSQMPIEGGDKKRLKQEPLSDEEFLHQYLETCLKEKKEPLSFLSDSKNQEHAKICIHLLRSIVGDIKKLETSISSLNSELKLRVTKTVLFCHLSLKLGFKGINWSPKASFETFQDLIIDHKYLYAYGYFSNSNWVDNPSKTKLHEREIASWDNIDRNPELVTTSIVVIGDIETTSGKESILYINPEDSSEKQTIYRLDYAFFCKYVVSIDYDINSLSNFYLLKYNP